MDDGVVGLVVSALLIVAICAAAIVFSHLSCHAQWDRAGMADVSWGPVQGCMVRLPDGRWLPSERIREIDIPKGKS